MKTPIQAKRYFQIAIAIVGMIFLILGVFYTNFSSRNPVLFLLLPISSGLLTQFPIKLLKCDFFLIYIIAILGSLIFDPTLTAFGILLGVLIGYLFRWLIREKKSWKEINNFNSWVRIGFIVGVNIIPLATIFFFIGISPSLGENTVEQYWQDLLFVNIIFMVLQGTIFYINFLTQEKDSSYPNRRSDIFTILKLDIISIIFIFVIMTIYSEYELEAVILSISIPIIIAYLLNKLNSARNEIERRDQELSTLNHISQTIQSTLNLDKLLPVIQEQVMLLLDVNNFYVALYDDKSAGIWYPFAMKNGEKQDWLCRPISDRLTDRVIQNGQAILFSPRKIQNSSIDELPTSDETPVSWLGVPLISSEHTIGCMAVFSLETGKYFSNADHDVMTILSGQASVAIQNALLYQQTEHRAYQLDILNQLTTIMTASLDLHQVLTQVSNSVAQVVGNEKSAIFLVDQGGKTASLAHAHGLTEEFQQRNAIISTKTSRRTRCLQTGMPVIVPDIQNSSVPNDFAIHYKTDKIQAFADFPLITPDGQVGFLSVFFSEKHDFPKEEIGLLQTFASQAALAVANARLHSQTDAALAQRVNQLTTLEAVSKELIAASHSNQLYDLILRYALEMTNSCCGEVSIINPESHLLEVKASKGNRLENGNFIFHSGVATSVARNLEVGNIDGAGPNQDLPGSMNGNIRSQLIVPIIHEERMLGEIAIASMDVSAYSESEQSFVSQLANHAAINIINAELYHELQNRFQEQSTLYQVSAQLVRDLSPEQVVEAVKQAIYSIIPPLEIGIYIWNQESGIYQLIGGESNHNPTTIDTSPELIRLSLKEFHSQANDLDNHLKTIFSAGCTNCQIYIFPFRNNQQRPGFLTLHLDKNFKVSENETELIKTIAAQGAISFLNARNFFEVKNVRDRLSAILNSIEEGILMIDTEGYVHIANEPISELTGFATEKFLRRKIYELPNHLLEAIGFDQPEINVIFQNLNKNQIATSPKTIIEPKDIHRKHIVERTMMPIWGQDSKIIGLIILIRDITEEREIKQTRDAITETIVHDVRSPMSAIVGALELLKDDLSNTGNSIAEQALLVAERSANRVISLTEELLDIARLQSGRMAIEMEDIDFHSLVEELMIDFTAIANENSVFIRNNVSMKTPLVRADSDKLIRILTNLVDNAINFSSHGGHVIISAEKEINRFLTIRVTDYGTGIPSEYKEKIFERFVQVPGQYSRRGGTGLGLTFCRLAVEAHGGQIWVDQNPDGGSIFAFTIPTV
ncbi:MAG: GAF domain-containing protein [Anaerolineales bacterium]